jgi:hypothetical protein
MNGMSNSMSRPNIAAPGEAFNTVWWVEQMAHASTDKKTSMSLAVHSSSSIAFAVGYLMLAGLRFMPYVAYCENICLAKWCLDQSFKLDELMFL